MPTSTLTTKEIVRAIQTRLLDFAPLGGAASLRTLLGGRVYYVTVPNTAQFPYAVMRLTGRSSSAQHRGVRETPDVELTIWHREDVWALEAIADTADQAMLGWKDTSAGVMFAQHRHRNPIPPGGTETDRTVIGILCRYPVVLWPTLLTRYIGASAA